MPQSSSRPVQEPKTQQLPQWHVILHNDDVNTAEFVTEKVRELTRLDEQDATLKVMEAHNEGSAILETTHRERAELIVDQFETFKIMATMEQA